jgi:hypothetical protein
VTGTELHLSHGQLQRLCKYKEKEKRAPMKEEKIHGLIAPLAVRTLQVDG